MLSFGKIALRVGAVTRADLKAARETRNQSGGSLEEILIEQGALTPELAGLVREALMEVSSDSADLEASSGDPSLLDSELLDTGRWRLAG